MISHDAAHFLVGEAIQKGIAAAGVVPNVYEIAPSDCGLAVYRKPVEAEQSIADEAEVEMDVFTNDIPLSAFIPTSATVLEPSFDEMTLKQLKDYAAAHDITLGNARTKPKIVQLLRGA